MSGNRRQSHLHKRDRDRISEYQEAVRDTRDAVPAPTAVIRRILDRVEIPVRGPGQVFTFPPPQDISQATGASIPPPTSSFPSLLSDDSASRTRSGRMFSEIPQPRQPRRQSTSRSRRASSEVDFQRLVQDPEENAEALQEVSGAAQERRQTQVEQGLTARVVRERLHAGFEKSSFYGLIQAAFEMEKAVDTPVLRSVELRAAFFALLPPVAAISLPILKVLINGNLARAYHEDEEIRKRLDKNRKLATSAFRIGSRERKTKEAAEGVMPAIYYRAHVDKNGYAPTGNMYLEAIRVIRKYCRANPSADEERQAFQIDTVSFNKGWTQDMTRKGLRRYLRPTVYLAPKDSWRTDDEYESDARGRRSSKKKNDRITPRNKKTVLDFCDQLENDLLREFGGRMHLPIPIPRNYVGWARIFSDREKEHEKHQSTNRLSSLFEDVFNLLYPGKYRLVSYVVGLLNDEEQAGLAEDFFSRLTNCFAATGGGYSSDEPGCSTKSRLTNTEAYGTYSIKLITDTDLIVNLDEQAERMVGFNKGNEDAVKLLAKLRRKMQDVDRLQKHLDDLQKENQMTVAEHMEDLSKYKHTLHGAIEFFSDFRDAVAGMDNLEDDPKLTEEELFASFDRQFRGMKIAEPTMEESEAVEVDISEYAALLKADRIVLSDTEEEPDAEYYREGDGEFSGSDNE